MNILSFEQKYLLLSKFMVHFASIGGLPYAKRLIKDGVVKSEQEVMLFNLLSTSGGSDFELDPYSSSVLEQSHITDSDN